MRGRCTSWCQNHRSSGRGCCWRTRNETSAAICTQAQQEVASALSAATHSSDSSARCSGTVADLSASLTRFAITCHGSSRERSWKAAAWPSASACSAHARLHAPPRSAASPLHSGQSERAAWGCDARRRVQRPLAAAGDATLSGGCKARRRHRSEHRDHSRIATTHHGERSDRPSRCAVRSVARWLWDSHAHSARSSSSAEQIASLEHASLVCRGRRCGQHGDGGSRAASWSLRIPAVPNHAAEHTSSSSSGGLSDADKAISGVQSTLRTRCSHSSPQRMAAPHRRVQDG